jgi:hypothetical protein
MSGASTDNVDFRASLEDQKSSILESSSREQRSLSVWSSNPEKGGVGVWGVGCGVWGDFGVDGGFGLLFFEVIGGIC